MAQAALDQRNTRYRGPGMRSMTEGDDGDDGAIWDRQRNAAMERLEQAEKVAERIVSKRIPQAVQKVRVAVRVGVLARFWARVRICIRGPSARSTLTRGLPKLSGRHLACCFCIA